MNTPTVQPKLNNRTGDIGYRVGISGISKALFFDKPELAQLRDQINLILKDTDSGSSA